MEDYPAGAKPGDFASSLPWVDLLDAPMTFGRESPLEFYAAMFGALKAVRSVVRGDIDPIKWLRDLDEWDRVMVGGPNGRGTSDWPGWLQAGLAQPDPGEPPPRKRKVADPLKARLHDLVDGPIPPAGQWVVYRHYDSAGFLLYVGKSSNFKSRHAQHRSGALWWKEIVRIAVQTVDDALQAGAVELEAIATEDPEWNVSYRP